jgi:hypothetical protein
MLLLLQLPRIRECGDLGGNGIGVRHVVELLLYPGIPDRKYEYFL